MLTPATEADLARVSAACAEFRALWASLRSMPIDAPFDGGPGDIEALDYLDYESLAYPPGGIASAALVWGNVLARQAGLEWVCSDRGELLLDVEELGCRLVFWPFGRVFEMQYRTLPQDNKYRRLTEWVLRECLDTDFFSGEIEGRLRRFLADIGGPAP